MSAAPLARVEELLARLETAREELEHTEDAEAAIDLLNEIARLAREAQAEIERAKREANG